MINALLQGIFKLIITLVGVILSPIDLLIQSSLPSLDNALTSFNALIDYVINFIGFCVDASGLSTTAIDLIVIYYSFVLVVPLSISTIKLAIKWYKALVP